MPLTWAICGGWWSVGGTLVPLGGIVVTELYATVYGGAEGFLLEPSPC
jgi:hypothetical protein